MSQNGQITLNPLVHDNFFTHISLWDLYGAPKKNPNQEKEEEKQFFIYR